MFVSLLLNFELIKKEELLSTVELSQQLKISQYNDDNLQFQYPFETLQGLSESEYELIYLQGGTVAAVLSQAPKDTVFGKLWENVR